MIGNKEILDTDLLYDKEKLRGPKQGCGSH